MLESLEIYQGIYDVVVENMNEVDEVFHYYKTTFMCDVANHPQQIDVSKYIHLPNKEFFQAIFVSTFKRLPDEKETNRWKKSFDEAPSVFQKNVLKYIVYSSVVAINHIVFVNNPYFTQKKGIRYRFLGMLYGLTDKSSLREFGKRLPMPIQNVVRKIFL